MPHEWLETAPTLIDLVRHVDVDRILRNADEKHFETLAYNAAPIVRALFCRELAGLSWNGLYEYLSTDVRAIRVGFDPRSLDRTTQLRRAKHSLPRGMWNSRTLRNDRFLRRVNDSSRLHTKTSIARSRRVPCIDILEEPRAAHLLLRIRHSHVQCVAARRRPPQSDGCSGDHRLYAGRYSRRVS